MRGMDMAYRIKKMMKVQEYEFKVSYRYPAMRGPAAEPRLKAKMTAPKIAP